jgi:hypothetical protein
MACSELEKKLRGPPLHLAAVLDPRYTLPLPHQLNDKAFLDETWAKLDFNGNGMVSLAEIDKMVVEQPDWQLCNNKPALMRAYKCVADE